MCNGKATAACYWSPWCFVVLLQVLYYDGQFDDARLNVALATTAAAAGATVANYVEATGLIKVTSMGLSTTTHCSQHPGVCAGAHKYAVQSGCADLLKELGHLTAGHTCGHVHTHQGADCNNT